MKLLLTSNRLCNQSISKALFELVGKPASKTTITFIPTAMNVTTGGKDWFVNDLYNIRKQGLKHMDIVDISALPKTMWLPRIEAADVLFFSGGDSSHLMHWLKKSGLAKLLPELLKTRVYAGISAGSIVTAPTLWLSGRDRKNYYKNVVSFKKEDGLGFVDFYVRPHFNSPHFPHAKKEYLEEAAKSAPDVVYALDDNSALKIEDNKIEIISEGEYLTLNQK